MEILKEQPTEGAFAMLWVFQGNIHTREYRWDNNRLLQFKGYNDSWVDIGYNIACNVLMEEDCTHTHYVRLSKATQMKELLLNDKHIKP